MYVPFAVRQLPKQVLRHYEDKNLFDQITRVSFLVSPSQIEVELGDREHIWAWTPLSVVGTDAHGNPITHRWSLVDEYDLEDAA